MTDERTQRCTTSIERRRFLQAIAVAGLTPSSAMAQGAAGMAECHVTDGVVRFTVIE